MKGVKTWNKLPVRTVERRTLNTHQMEHHHHFFITQRVSFCIRIKLLGHLLADLAQPLLPTLILHGCTGQNTKVVLQKSSTELQEGFYHWPCTLSRCRWAAWWPRRTAGPVCCAAVSSSGLPLPGRRQDPCCPPSWSSQPPWCCSCSSLQGDYGVLRNFGLSAGSMGLCNKEQKTTGTAWIPHKGTCGESQCQQVWEEKGRSCHSCQSMRQHQGSSLQWAHPHTALPDPFWVKPLGPPTSWALKSSECHPKRQDRAVSTWTQPGSVHSLHFQGNQQPQRGWQRKLSSPHFLSWWLAVGRRASGGSTDGDLG